MKNKRKYSTNLVIATNRIDIEALHLLRLLQLTKKESTKKCIDENSIIKQKFYFYIRKLIFRVQFIAASSELEYKVHKDLYLRVARIKKRLILKVAITEFLLYVYVDPFD